MDTAIKTGKKRILVVDDQARGRPIHPREPFDYEANVVELSGGRPLRPGMEPVIPDLK